MWNLLTRQTQKLTLRILNSHCVNSRNSSTVDLSHKIYGSVGPVPAIVVLHGLLGSKRNWNTMCKKIHESTKRAVIAVDARNHGDSPHADSHLYLDLAADVSRLMAKLALKEAMVMGHSMGGRTAMVLALIEPTKVSSLIVVDISPVSFPSAANDFFPKLMDVMKAITFESTDMAKAKTEARQKLQASGIIEHPGFLEFVLLNLGIKGGKIGWVINIDGLKNNFENVARFPVEVAGKMYHGPTLFVGGGESHFLPESDLPLIKQIFPQATIQVVPKAGHNVHAETPQDFFDIVNKFIKHNSIK